MAYSPEVVRAARERLEERRTRAVTQAAERERALCAQSPRLAQIRRQLCETLPRLTSIILSGGDPQALDDARRENLALQEEQASILRSLGVASGSFEPQYTCPVCQDTGYAEGHICACYQKLLREEACRRLSSLSALKLTDFDDLDLTVYDDTVDQKLGVSPRKRMADIIAYCRSYAQDFSPASPSLLFQGATGTGKTHLSLAIARTAAERGYGVIYGSVQPLLRRMESEHFGRTDGDTEEQLIACDLLVLDDLGMEFDSPFYRTCIYSLLNDRLLEGRPTIVSTNLSFSAIGERYGDQIASRIVGGFELLMCVGRDVRQIMRYRAMR